jgi:hypothetical protein
MVFAPCQMRQREDGVAAASDLLVFGMQDFAEGGGAQPWLCVRKRDGWVYGFDPDEDNPMFLLNSSIERFVATLPAPQPTPGKQRAVAVRL